MSSTYSVQDAETSIQLSLRARLRELITSADVGDRLPGERELSERWGVARMTLRKVMDSLISEGLAERKQGSGTYVTPQPTVRLLGLTSFSQDMRDRGLVPTSKLLDFSVAPADIRLASQLHISVGEAVRQFTRLRMADGEPMAVETVWLPDHFVPGLNRAELNESLYELLAARYRIVPGAAHVIIEPTVPGPDVRKLLSMTKGQACLRIRLADSDVRGRVIMVSDCLYRGDRYQLTADITGATFTAAKARRLG